MAQISVSTKEFFRAYSYSMELKNINESLIYDCIREQFSLRSAIVIMMKDPSDLGAFSWQGFSFLYVHTSEKGKVEERLLQLEKMFWITLLNQEGIQVNEFPKIKF